MTHVPAHRVNGRRQPSPIGVLPLARSGPVPVRVRPARDPRGSGLRRRGRWAIVALPGYAAVELVVTLRGSVPLAAFGVLLGMVGLTAIALLLAGDRGAGTGAVAAVVGFAGLVGAALAGPPARADRPTLPNLLEAAGLALAGAAVIRSRTFKRADGWLLLIGAPALYLGQLVSTVTTTMGALLLLAAAIGIARSAPATGPG